MPNLIKSVIEFLRIVKDSEFVLIKFIKKDGTERLMKATLNFNNIPKDKKPKKVDLIKILELIQKQKLLRVFDLDKLDWRTVPFESVDFIQTIDSKRRMTTYTIESKIKK